MAVYNLAGAGVQGLTPGVDQLLVDVITFPSRASAGRATPTNYYDIGLLRVGHLGSYYPAQPIDAASMQIDLPLGVNQLGYSLFDTTNIRVTEVFASAAGNITKVTETYQAPVAAGATSFRLWSYTVPSARVFRLGYMGMGITGGIAGTIGLRFMVDGAYLVACYNGTSGQASEFSQASIQTHLYLAAGQTVEVDADNTSAAAQFAYAYLTGEEFDAAVWVPN